MQRRVSLRRKSKKRAALDRSVAKARLFLREEASGWAMEDVPIPTKRVQRRILRERGN
jgi:hypothetical protein